MTTEEREALQTKKRRKMECFGRSHTAEEWAKKLEMSFDLFQYYTETRGLTVEELYDLRGFIYQEPKKGKYMQAALERLGPIFEQSGYTDIDALELQRRAGQQVHVVVYQGSTVGKYFYKDNRLVLADGGMALDKLDLEQFKIQRDGDVWRWHPETKGLWLRQTIK